MTYLATEQGWLYLCAVRDGCSRRVLGWAIDDHHAPTWSKRRCIGGESARRTPRTRSSSTPTVAANSPRPSWPKRLPNYPILQSVGRTGVCWDNAATEIVLVDPENRVLRPLQLGHQSRSETRRRRWIEERFNRLRRHSALGMLSPVRFEDHLHQQAATAAA